MGGAAGQARLRGKRRGLRRRRRACPADGAGGRGGATGTRGALREVVGGPFGQLMLGLIAVGLCGYVLWRFIQAVMDADRKGSDAKGLAVRSAYAFSGLVYAGLAMTAIKILLGSGGGGEGEAREWTTWLLSMPLGGWVVGLIGLGVIGVGLFQFYKAYTAKFREQLRLAAQAKRRGRGCCSWARQGSRRAA